MHPRELDLKFHRKFAKWHQQLVTLLPGGRVVFWRVRLPPVSIAFLACSVESETAVVRKIYPCVAPVQSAAAIGAVHVVA